MAGNQDKPKPKSMNVHERLSSSLSKFRENMEKIKEVTESSGASKAPEKKEEQPK